MKPGKLIAWLGLGVLVFGGAGLGFAAVEDTIQRQALKSNDLTGIRREALTLFPRGSRLRDAATRLFDIGFACEPVRRGLADISGPALICASNGRGYPDYPAVNVTVSTRNGLVSEIEVWNVIAQSDDDASMPGLAQEERPSAAVLTASNEPAP